MKKRKLLNVKELSLRKFFLSGVLTVSGLASVANMSAQVTGTKTIGATGDYVSAARAIYDINTNRGGVGVGGVVLELKSDYAQTLDTVPAVTGASATNPIIVRPQASLSVPNVSLLVSGSYVNVDGRVGSTGTTKALTLTNTSTSGVTLTITGSNNTIQFVNLLGSNTDNTKGIVLVSGTANKIDYCDISSNGTSYSANSIAGTAGTSIVSNCSIHDVFSPTLDSRGVCLSGSSTGWTITGNSFYNTTSTGYVATVNRWHYQVFIASGSGYTVSNNYFGGRSANCGTDGVNELIGVSAAGNGGFVFRHIYLESTTTTKNTISGNTFKNISVFTGQSLPSWSAIYVVNKTSGASTDILNNTIGSTTLNGSIKYELDGTNGGLAVAPIYYSDNSNSVASNVVVSGNTIAGITTSALSATTGTIALYGISCVNYGTIDVHDNLVGSLTTANSIQNLPIGKYGGIGKNTIGISVGNGAASVYNNTIANINACNTGAQLEGIECADGASAQVYGNVIRDLSSNITSGADPRWPITGIYFKTKNATILNSAIYGNTIYNISNTQTYGHYVSGICVSPVTTSLGVSIYKNNIYNIIPSANGYAHGIDLTNESSITNTVSANIYNNIVRLGKNADGSDVSVDAEVFGISNKIAGGGVVNYYYNTVSVGGNLSVSGTKNSAALNDTTKLNGSREIKNNIFFNSRSNVAGGTAKHYAVALTMTAIKNGANLTTSNNNDYYVSGTGSFVGGSAKTDCSDLAAWTAANVGGSYWQAAPDANSISVSPVFVSATDLHLSQTATANNALKVGAALSIVTDFDGNSRGGVPTLGADEYTGPGTAIQSLNTNDLLVYSSQKGYITIDGVKELSDNNRVMVYNFVGQKVFDQKLSTSTQVLNTTFAQGTYIVAVEVNGSKEVRKVIVR